MFSKEKAEKVVKPPQKPVIKNNFINSDGVFFNNKPDNKPIKKHPKTLLIKVLHGKFETWLLTKNVLIIYLKTQPNAPPVATKIKFFIIVLN